MFLEFRLAAEANSLVRAIRIGRFQRVGNDIGCTLPESTNNAHVGSASLRAIRLAIRPGLTWGNAAVQDLPQANGQASAGADREGH